VTAIYHQHNNAMQCRAAPSKTATC